MKTLKGHLFFLFLLVCKILYSQEINIDTIPPRPMNSFNLNLGDASGISLSYERLFKIGENFLLAGRIGLGFNEEYRLCLFPHDCETATEKYLSVPASVTMNFGKMKKFFEVGIGSTKLHGSLDQHYWLYPIIGYRFQPLIAGKFNFRINFSFPFGGYNMDDILFAPGSISTGVLF